jgi:hypothetical protein
MTRLPSMSPAPGRASPTAAGKPAVGSPHPSPLDPKRAVALLQQQCLLYQQLRDLSARQGQHIKEGQTEPLLTVLAQRQRVLAELTAIADEMAPYRAHWPQVRAALSADQQQQVNAMVQEVEQQLAHIIQQDERDRTQLQNARNQVGSELTKLNKVSAAAAAYRPAPQPGSQNRFTSQQG